MDRLLRLQPSAALKEKRLTSLRAGSGTEDTALREAVQDAQILGSLELAGLAHSWNEVRASRAGQLAPEAVVAMHSALRAVPAQAAFSVAALLAWHRAVLPGGGGALRGRELARADGPPPAPVAVIEGRLGIVEEWLATDSARALSPEGMGALAMSRVMEILPFEAANGRVARLAASHLVVRAGGHPPILAGGDRARLAACLAAAFRLEMEPLAELLREASERALDVMIQVLERR
jgi:Fic family protein